MSNYCKNCNVQITPGMKFCKSCGAACNEPAKPGANRKIKVIVIVVAVLLILLSIQNMSLNIAGKSVPASIISVRQDTRSNDSSVSVPDRYIVKYEFFVDGKSYIGESTLTFKYGVISEQTIKVLYMPFWPGINSASDSTKIAGSLVLAGLGALLLILGIKGKITFGR